MIEKAYAKAHGSYQSISGGQIAEALLDLTGCPTFAMNLGDRDFDSEKLWRNLVKWKRLSYPMGCATDPVPDLREVGLCGSHAYVSGLPHGPLQRKRQRFRIRNHGVGSGTGIGPTSRQVERGVSLGRHGAVTRVVDGTFCALAASFIIFALFKIIACHVHVASMA